MKLRIVKRYVIRTLIILSVYFLISSAILLLVVDDVVNYHSEENHQALFMQQQTRKQLLASSNSYKMPQNRLSSVSCSEYQHTCLISNLYIINKTLHAFVGKDGDTFNASEFNMDTRILTGIGWGSHVMLFQIHQPRESSSHDDGPSDKDLWRQYGEMEYIDGNTTIIKEDYVPPTKNYNVLENKSKTIVLHIHLYGPPKIIPKSTKYYVEPTSFFSVLWENLFRTMYAGVGAWYTLIKNNVFFTEHHRFVLIESDPKPFEFIPLLQLATPFPITIYDEMEHDSIYRAATIGISRDVQVAEISREIEDEYRFHHRSIAFRSFCDRIKEKVLSLEPTGNFFSHSSKDWIFQQLLSVKESLSFSKKKLRLSLVLRQGSTRKIMNQQEIVNMIQTIPQFDLKVYDFNSLNLRQQIYIIDRTDVLLSMHGAALTHTLFLNPDSYVVELFPYAFRKMVFQNLAKIMGVNYLFWQNSRWSDSRANWTRIAHNRMTDMPKEKIVQLPINWYNMDSKNYWRNQDTDVNIPELKKILELVIENSLVETKYLMYQPWEQFNNQIIGFKSACAISIFLNRTLVVPYLGYRKQQATDGDKYIPFESTKFVWKSFERYFDSKQLLGLPCKYISLDNFYNINGGRAIEEVRFHPMGERASASVDQLKEYYLKTIKIPIPPPKIDTNIHYQLTSPEIISAYSTPSRVLALGSMFWHYNFNLTQTYPLDHFYNFLDNPMYRRISESLMISERITSIVDRIDFDTERFIAIHLRMGDYKEKCSNDFSDNVTESCLPSYTKIIEKLHTLYAPDFYDTLYVATNGDTDEIRKALQEPTHRSKGDAKLWKNVLFLDDLIGHPPSPVEETTEEQYQPIQEIASIDATDFEEPGETPLRMDLDELDLGLLDQVICMRARGFVGNFYSSFSRHIIEGRELAGLRWYVF